MEIRIDDLDGPEIAALLQEHLQSAALHSPAGSIHALDLEHLRSPDITFWTAWQQDRLLGCCAIRELDPTHGEIKSMRTASAHLRKGVASRLLTHAVEQARERHYRRLSLETGSMQAFQPAHALYAAFGFELCGPFSDYLEDPHSVFMTKTLD